MYLYDMPYGVLRELCRVLDAGDRLWKDLAGALDYTVLEIQFLELEYNRLHGSPTERLLIRWGQSNATVDMLACKLKSINAVRGLNIIRQLVSSSLQESLYDVEKNNEIVINVSALPVFTETPQISDDSLPPPSGSFKVNNNCCNTNTDGKCMPLYDSLYKATNGFEEKNIIRKSAEGTIYKGYLEKVPVAIKVFKKQECTKLSPAFYNKVEEIKKLKHHNIINYKNVALDGPFVCVVQPLVENGSLRDRLDCKDNTPPLTLIQRHKIVQEASNGLLYLHSQTENHMVHGNLKSTNILLGVNMEAKLSDFKMEFESNGVITNQCTNMTFNLGKDSRMLTLKAYMPDEYFINGFETSSKTDIYSFGVIIFETCTREPPFNERRGRDNMFLRQYINTIFELKNNKLLGLKDASVCNWSDNLWIKLMSLGKMCTLGRKNDRPLTNVVNDTLKLYLNEALNYVTIVDKKCYDDEPIKDTEKTIKPVDNSSNDTGDLINFLSNLKTTEVTKLHAENNTDIYSSNSDNSQISEKPIHTKNFDSDIWPSETPDPIFSKEIDCALDDIKRLKKKNLLQFLDSDVNDTFKSEETQAKSNNETLEKELSFNLKSSELGSPLNDKSLCNSDDISLNAKSSKLIESDSVTKMREDDSNFIQLSKKQISSDEERFSRLRKLKEKVQNNM